jgi:hypothetical protein
MKLIEKSLENYFYNFIYLHMQVERGGYKKNL